VGNLRRLLMLLQIFLDAFGLAQQERNMLIGDLKEMLNYVQGLLELLGELHMLLVAPGVAEPRHLRVQSGQSLPQVAIELLEVMRETPQFQGINDCLGHGTLAEGGDEFPSFSRKPPSSARTFRT
jgi:hypothetical protein